MEKQPSPAKNFAEIGERRKEVRETLKDETTAAVQRVHKAELKASKIPHGEGPIAEAGGFGAAKELLKKHEGEAVSDKEAFAHGIDERKIRIELGAEYDTLAKLTSDLEELEDFEIRRLREISRDPYAQRMQASLLAQIKQEKQELEKELTQSELRDPTVARAFELVRLREGLFEEGHIAHTESVEKYLAEIGVRMIHGKPMFVHGPTGTGKTSLARYAAKHFTGKSAEMVYCTPQTREAHIWGKTGIRPAGEDGAKSGAIETVELYGPLVRAAQSGSIVAFDEFTALPKELMVFLKGVANAKPGDRVTVPGNGEVEIMPGFQMIFTANLKSEKNPERQDLPPEIAREFEQNNIEVGYTPKSEAYDIMLARLMQPDGSLEISDYDAHTTLPKLCEAMEEIQLAYTDQMNADAAREVGALDAAGRRPSLKKFVMTQGTVEAILESWPTERQLHNGISFAEYVDKRLATGLSFKEYPATDRQLAAKIFAAKGFLRTVTPEELGLPPNTLDFDAARRARAETVAETRTKSTKVRVMPLKEVAKLDPFEVRGRRMREEADDLLSGVEEAPDPFVAEMMGKSGGLFGAETFDTAKALEENREFIHQTLEAWYGVDADFAIEKVEAVDPRSQDYADLAEAISKISFGEYTLNPEMQGVDFERARVFVPDLSAFAGKPIHEVVKHVVDVYGDKYHVPGIEYWKWLVENPTKNPPGMQIKDGNFYACPGSVLRGKGGIWTVPGVRWPRVEWSRSSRLLSHSWDVDCRVVLLEK